MADRSIDFHLADAEARHREAPRAFFIPARSERESLTPGELAKLLFEIVDPGDDMPGGERMWVEVMAVEDGRYVGALTNQPHAITTIQLGDAIRFGPEHVISTVEEWPLLEKKILVSRRSHVDDERPRWVYREDPDNDEDSGWRALVGDETDEEVNDAANALPQQLGYLLDRWPNLRPVFETDPRNGAWTWDEPSGTYRAAEPGA